MWFAKPGFRSACQCPSCCHLVVGRATPKAHLAHLGLFLQLDDGCLLPLPAPVGWLAGLDYEAPCLLVPVRSHRVLHELRFFYGRALISGSAGCRVVKERPWLLASFVMELKEDVPNVCIINAGGTDGMSFFSDRVRVCIGIKSRELPAEDSISISQVHGGDAASWRSFETHRDGHRYAFGSAVFSLPFEASVEESGCLGGSTSWRLMCAGCTPQQRADIQRRDVVGIQSQWLAAMAQARNVVVGELKAEEARGPACNCSANAALPAFHSFPLL